MKKAIVCVDDDILILQSLKSQLKDIFNGEFLTEIAESPSEALELIDFLAEKGIELVLIICDWLMPDMRGDTLLNELKNKGIHVRAIMLSGQADALAVEKAFESGLLAFFIPKPWQAEDLAEKIRLLLPKV